MSNSVYPRLCGGTFFTLVLQALKQRAKAREHYNGERDGLSDPEVLTGLIKVINPDYLKTGLEPTEISFRNLIGRSFALDRLREIPPVVEHMLNRPEKYAGQIRNVLETHYFNPGHAGEAAGRYILQTLINRKKQKGK